MQDLNDRNDPEVFSLKAQKPWCVKLQLNKAPSLPDEKQLQCSKDTQAASFYIQKKAGRWQKKKKKKITASASYPCLTGASLFTRHDLQVTPMSIPRHRRIGVQSNKAEHAPESFANWCWKVLKGALIVRGPPAAEHNELTHCFRTLWNGTKYRLHHTIRSGGY